MVARIAVSFFRSNLLTISLTILLGGGILSWVAFINGYPLIYDDTGSYLRDGINLIHFKYPVNARPIFYGLIIWFLHWEKSLWPIVIVQGIITAHVIWLTLRVNNLKIGLITFLSIIAVLAIITPISLYVSNVMPDIFLGILILGMFLIGWCLDQLNLGEIVYLFLLVASCMCFHLSFIPIATSIAVTTFLIWYFKPNLRTIIHPFLLLGATGLALSALLSFSLIFYKSVSLAPASPPFLLARILADGPGKAYLQDTCEQKAYVICQYLDQLPSTENDFLWKFIPNVSKSNPELWTAIPKEQTSIVFGAVRMFPLWTTKNILSNTARQLITFDSSMSFNNDNKQLLAEHSPFTTSSFAKTLQAEGFFSESKLQNINKFHTAIILISLISYVCFSVMCYHINEIRPLALAALAALGLVTNAFVTGALAGVFGRYEGRAIWLIPLCSIVLYLALVKSRAGTSTKNFL